MTMNVFCALVCLLAGIFVLVCVFFLSSFMSACNHIIRKSNSPVWISYRKNIFGVCTQFWGQEIKLQIKWNAILSTEQKIKHTLTLAHQKKKHAQHHWHKQQQCNKRHEALCSIFRDVISIKPTQTFSELTILHLMRVFVCTIRIYGITVSLYVEYSQCHTGEIQINRIDYFQHPISSI